MGITPAHFDAIVTVAVDDGSRRGLITTPSLLVVVASFAVLLLQLLLLKLLLLQLQLHISVCLGLLSLEGAFVGRAGKVLL